jgi:hypothetical protein
MIPTLASITLQAISAGHDVGVSAGRGRTYAHTAILEMFHVASRLLDRIGVWASRARLAIHALDEVSIIARRSSEWPNLQASQAEHRDQLRLAIAHHVETPQWSHWEDQNKQIRH